MNNYGYFFSASCEQCRAYVRFNGVPLLETEPDRPASSSENLSIWALPEVSRLEVSLAKVPSTPNQDVKFSGKIQRLAVGAPPAAVETIWEFAWPPSDLGDVVPFYCVFEIETLTPSELWKRAEVLRLDEPTVADVLNEARRLHTIFASGDHVRLGDELLFRAHDVGSVLGRTKQVSEERLREFLKTIMTPTEFKFVARPFKASERDVRLIANERVMRVRNGAEPLLLSTEGQGMELYLARLENRWTCVR